MIVFSRRDFLKWFTSALLGLSGMLGLGGLFRYLAYTAPQDTPRQFDLGPVDDFPLGSRTIVAEGRFVLVHNEKGVSAISTTCTHLGCRLYPGPDGFTCPCHGSRFDIHGNVLKGPAVLALDSQHVELTDKGHIVLQNL